MSFEKIFLNNLLNLKIYIYIFLHKKQGHFSLSLSFLLFILKLYKIQREPELVKITGLDTSTN